MKPKNVLILSEPTYHAKICDFRHSILDTGEVRHLVGGTNRYAAPEWKTHASTSQLLKIDIYSYGLIFSNLILGGIVYFGPKRDLTPELIYDQILEADQTTASLHLKEFPMIKAF
jgi:serine/threonine protein kinase